MTDDSTSQSLPKKEDKKPTPQAASAQGGARTNKRTASVAKNQPGAPVASGGQRPSSRSSNGNTKKSPSSDTAPASSGTDSKKKDTRPDNRSRNPSYGGQGGGRNASGANGGSSAKKPATTRPGGNAGSASKDQQAATKANPVPVPSASATDGLSSLKRVIDDLKSISPPSTTTPIASMPSSVSMPLPQLATSNLPVNAPVFQPGAAMYPPNVSDAPRHRKAASLGAHTSPNAFGPAFINSFSPNLGSMMEDSEDAGSGPYDEGESPEGQFPMSRGPGGFVAPRFAALAAQQQEQGEVLGPSGRPQLAPTFQFGARRRQGGSMSVGMASSIGEEEGAGFQFPQPGQSNFAPDASGPANVHRRSGSEITPMMAEQMALQSQIEALQQQQQALLQQQLAANQVMAQLNQNAQLNFPRGNAHRRIQSQQVPMGMAGQFGGVPNVAALNLAQMNAAFGGGVSAMGAGEQARGHGRRHSVNVINSSKPAASNPSPIQTFQPQQLMADSFEDGFVSPVQLGGHSRSGSRFDNSWRINGGAGAIQSNPTQSADLAQAQAQLQSLQQFRANSGGHHQKLPSFALPNMLPNIMAANMMGMGGFNFLQQQQQFQMQLQQQSNQPQRKSLFAPYLPQASIPPLLAAGKLVVGILRVNKRNRSDAYVSTEVLDSDIYICGSKDRNRALEGDIVAVELLDVDEVWGTKKEKEEKKRKKEENAAYDPKGANGRKNDKKKDDVEVEGQGLMLFEDEEVNDEVKPQFAGHVVAVVERMPGQLFSGTLGLLRPSSAATKEKQEAERREREGDRGTQDEKRGPVERPKIVWFKPTDKRVPLIAIPTEQAPPDFVNNSETYADKLFVACIKRHPISSLHPFGTLVEELGPIGDVEVETSALLKDCNFPTEDFTENVIKCLPPVPWTIPERELELRRDLREERVFTIDPESAKDLDDALSIKANDDGTFTVGVHIADVSFFVKPNTALDRDARKRATSVYLVQRSVPMLPPTLSEQLCSLAPGEERLAFSVIYTLTADGRVLDKWFGKTVIKSATQLSYTHAQAAIEGQTLTGVSASPEHQLSAIEQDIRSLNSIAKAMRARRFQNGSLALGEAQLSFTLDEEGRPVDCSSAITSDSKELVEEFMILTNVTVAQQIAVHLPEQALLRRHEEPIERRLVAFAERTARLDIPMDTSSAAALQKSIKAIENESSRNIIEMLARKAIHRAKYFCAGMLDIAKYGHYALNAPLYTHFTSPIRRYADIMVHRQLESVLSGPEPKFTMDRDSVAKLAQHCNIKRDSAKLAQEQSIHLFLCVLVSDLTQRYGPVVRQATVVGVLDAAFDVYVPEFGIEKRVHVDQMPIENHVYDEHTHTLQIYWSERDVISWLAENSDDEHLKKVKQTAEQHAVKMEVASRSVMDESALFADDEEDIVLERADDRGKSRETSKQRLQSMSNDKPEFQGLRTTPSGHKIQDIKEFMTVPVIVTADLTKSPPVIKVYSVNPYATSKK